MDYLFWALALLLLKEPCESLTDIVPNTGAALPDDAGNVVDETFLFLFHKNVRTYYSQLVELRIVDGGLKLIIGN